MLILTFKTSLHYKFFYTFAIVYNANIFACIVASVQFEVNPGGSALNTVRILKQLGTDALFFGAVGEDKAAEKLKEILQESEIEAR